MRITKNELVAANSKLGSDLLALRGEYSQAMADNVRLRLTSTQLQDRNQELSDQLEAIAAVDVSTVSYPVEYRVDTCKRIAIKFKAMSRFNHTLAQYEIKRDGEWVTAPSA